MFNRIVYLYSVVAEKCTCFYFYFYILCLYSLLFVHMTNTIFNGTPVVCQRCTYVYPKTNDTIIFAKHSLLAS